jgi:hypothetical protein
MEGILNHMTLSDVIAKRVVYGKDAVITDSVTAKTAVFSDNNTTQVVRITQEGTGNALVVEDQAHPDQTPFAIQNDGKVLIGNNTPFSGSNAPLQVNGVIRSRLESNTTSTGIAFDRARGSFTAPSAIANGDNLGNVDFYGYDGASYLLGGRILSEAQSNATLGDFIARMSFFTRDSAGIGERMRITGGGRVGINTTSPAAQFHVNGKVHLQGTPTFPDNSAAIAGGLVADDVYKTSNGELRIVYTP